MMKMGIVMGTGTGAMGVARRSTPITTEIKSLTRTKKRRRMVMMPLTVTIQNLMGTATAMLGTMRVGPRVGVWVHD